MKLKSKILFATIFCVHSLWGQNFNYDQCQFAYSLGLVQNYCSEQNEFSTIDATLSPETLPFCWFGTPSNDVWFTFIPTAFRVL